ncbi:MAG: four helix bundle protein [Phycisphaeraceae bacterium]
MRGARLATFERFEDIEDWRCARQLTNGIYDITRHGAFTRDYDLRSQIRRASVSIMSNMAEGFERDGTREFVQFLSQAKGSAGEVKAQLYVALEQG